MIYTNDEADKIERRKNFNLTVYLLPALTAGIAIALAYLAYSSGHLPIRDFFYASVLSLTLAMFVHAFNRRHWLKMPDGTYHNVKGIPPTNKIALNEPATYEAEYFYSKKEKTASFLSGLFLIGFSIWLSQKEGKTVLMPISSALGGLFLSYIGVKGLLDKTPRLKIARNGLWTRKLGFVHWDDINYADVVGDKKGQEEKRYLEIRLKGTKFEEADQPDERLLLTDLQNNDGIELVINQSILNYNTQKDRQATS